MVITYTKKGNKQRRIMVRD